MDLKIPAQNPNVCSNKFDFFELKSFLFQSARQFKYINEHELLQMKQEDG